MKKRKVVEKRWALLSKHGHLTVGPKSYPKYAAKQDATFQRAEVVRVTLTYEVPQ